MVSIVLKIILLSDCNSIHTQRWAISLSKKKVNITIFSFFEPYEDNKAIYKKFKINIVSPNLAKKINNLSYPSLSKIRYLQSIFLLKKTIKNLKPDIIHAHYASSYGFIALLSGFKPFVTSAWGSDIYLFPKRNFVNFFIMKKIINKSHKVFSTSNAMKNEIVENFKRDDIQVIPFGIDIDLFKPSKTKTEKFVVGTIKSIEKHNGIDCFLEAVEMIIHKHNKNIEFIIVGKGTEQKLMEKKAFDLKIGNNVNFLGFVPHHKTIDYFNELSIFVAVSTRESFGVSVLEAAACEIPSITSNIGGLVEVNKNGETGLIINPNNPKELAEAIIKLYENNKLRKILGRQARERVIKYFNWENNVIHQLDIYRKIAINDK